MSVEPLTNSAPDDSKDVGPERDSITTSVSLGGAHRWRLVVTPLLAGSLLGLGILFIHRELSQYRFREVADALEELAVAKIVAALVLTALSYFVLTGYDFLALRWIGRRLPYRRVALASFVGYVFSYNIGLSILGGSATRYRLYSSWGLSTLEIAKIIGFCALSFWVGALTIGGASFVVEPLVLPVFLHLPFSTTQPLGVLLLGIVVAYVGATAFRRTPIRTRNWEVSLPHPRFAAAQIVVSALDWLVAAWVLYSLLPERTISFSFFSAVYLLGALAGVVSHVPGGLGVFETVIVFFLSPTIPVPVLLASLLAYRVVYYLLPLLAASLLLAANEIRLRKDRVGELVQRLEWVPRVIPSVLGLGVFVGGVILLLSGATPAEAERLRWLHRFVPLPVLELSHFFGSVVGAGLLLLARELQRRSDAAYYASVILLMAGILTSLFKGWDYEEALVLGLMLLALVPSRKEFYRRASLFSDRFSWGWTVAVIVVLAGSLWFSFFVYRHVEFSDDLFWHFAFRSDAPRSLRAAVGSAMFLTIIAAVKLFRPGTYRPAPASPGELETVRRIVSSAPETSARLALLGDKTFLFNDDRTAFVMYAVEGRSWIALGDPVGPAPERMELLWRFRELAERHGGWPVFYEVQARNVHFYLDIGLTVLKLGEEGRVPLASFSLEGSANKGLRTLRNRHEKDGSVFQIVAPDGLETLLPRLREISDAWLVDKNSREKRFSLGFFAEDYIRQFPMGTIWRDGALVGFANLWTGANKEELSIDLMRYHPLYAPSGVMEYLFLRLMLWGKEEGYRWFNLGMAPMSGLQDRALAPLWHKVGAFVFRHGENFYNFQGLRSYKEKFHPVWEARYLACPGGFTVPTVVTNVATLISGGLLGVVRR